MHQLDVEPVAERLHHLVGLVVPQQAMIDENAGQLLADRLVDQHRRDRRIDPSRQPADHPPIADLRPDPSDFGGAEAGHGPGTGQSDDTMGEVAQQLGAVRSVDDLHVELHPVEPPCVVGDGGEWRPLTGRHHPEARRQPSHPVAVAHPDLLPPARRPGAMEQRAVVGDIDIRSAELAVIGRFDSPAELVAQQLFAVADAQYRHASPNTTSGARGDTASCTDAGPPDRMIPRGFHAVIRSAAALNGQISQ